VLEALHAAFRGKCYLCEAPLTIGSLEVDHRRPRGDARFEHLEHEWSNLFPTCATFRCNRRRKRYPNGDLVSPGERVEQRVVQKVERTISTCLTTTGMTAFVFEPADHADTPATNTATELSWIHNSGTMPATELRNAVLQHVGALEPGMTEFQKMSVDPSASPVALEEARRRAQRFVSRDAPFTMLVRSYFAHLPAIRALFD
jgi:hypothetical protein